MRVVRIDGPKGKRGKRCSGRKEGVAEGKHSRDLGRITGNGCSLGIGKPFPEIAQMRQKKDPELVTPKKMAEMMSALYPVRAKKNGFPRFRYDFVISRPTQSGVHPPLQGWKANQADAGPLRGVFEPAVP